MSTVVFSGPTLPARDITRALPDARVLSPAASGDVYRAARDGALTIALIDGVFDQAQAVRHKEILWALSRGVRVLGAASMGALRAAELADFGMEGIGAVFAAFASGELEDDDEVAVTHAPAEQGYLPLSQAMVNVRATCQHAVAHGILDEAASARLIGTAKSLFYPERVWSTILAAPSHGLDPAALERLRRFVSGPNAVDVKQRDARALLQRLHELSRDPTSSSVTSSSITVEFAHTEAWHELMRSFDADLAHLAEPALAGPPELAADALHGPLGALLLASRRRGAVFLQEVWQACVDRALALELARRDGIALAPEQADAASEQFRRERGLLSAEALTAWMQDNQLDPVTYSAFVHDQALATRVAARARTLALAQLPAVLCARGHLSVLWREALGAAR